MNVQTRGNPLAFVSELGRAAATGNIGVRFLFLCVV